MALPTAGIWLALLAWDNDTTVENNVESGPYAFWQVVAVAVLIGGLVVCALACGLSPGLIVSTVGATLAACMAVSFTALAPPPDDADLWPVGVALIFFATAMGCAVVCLIVSAVKPRTYR